MNKDNVLVTSDKFITKFMTFFFNSSSGRRKFYSSLWAIFFGIVIMLIIFSSLSPSLTIRNVFESISSTVAFNKKGFFLEFSCYVLAAIAIAIGFKSGIFNIGVSGQMMMGGIAGFLYLFNRTSSQGESITIDNSWDVVVTLFITIFAAILFALIAGILKAFLNVNEVVSTILLNWIAFYVGKYAFGQGSIYTNTTASNSKSVTLPSVFSQENFWPIVLVFTIFAALLIWIIFQKTTLGYKLKLTGLNKNNSSYAGVKEKWTIVGTMAFSGLFAGIAGFVWFIIIQRDYYVGSSPIALGFDSIGISLLAFNSPLGILLASLLYPTLHISWPILIIESGNAFENDLFQTITGIIIYLVALGVIFTKIRPIEYTYKMFILLKSKHFRLSFVHFWQQLHKNYKIKNQEIKTINVKLKQNSQLSQDDNYYEELVKIKNLTIKQHVKFLKLKHKNLVDWKAIDKMNDVEKLQYFETKQKEKNDILDNIVRIGGMDKQISSDKFKASFVNLKNNFKQEMTNIIQNHNGIVIKIKKWAGVIE